jgi:predicted DNA-binding protein (UPF0251 family)
MPRRPLERAVLGLPPALLYKPAGRPARGLESVHLAIDELEAMRLVDHQGLSQEEAACLMGVSRQTVGRIVESARKKVADALLNAKALEIGGGPYQVAPAELVCLACDSHWPAAQTYPETICPTCGSSEVLLPSGPLMGGWRGRGRGAEHGGGMGRWRGHRGGQGGAGSAAPAAPGPGPAD